MPVHALEDAARDLAGAEARDAHVAPERAIGLVELGGDVGPGKLELDALLDGGDVFNRDLHGEGAPCLPSPPGFIKTRAVRRIGLAHAGGLRSA